MRLEEEHAKILGIVDENIHKDEASSWTKFNGDVCCRIIKEHLEKHIEENLKIVGPNVYVEGFPAEFDLFVVDKDATPKRFTNAYSSYSIRYLMEIKKRGIYGGRDDLKRAVKRIFDNFNSVAQMNQSIRCIYLTIQEVWKPKRKSSIDYLEETKKGLQPFEVFALKESRSQEMIKGEWERLIEYIRS